MRADLVIAGVGGQGVLSIGGAIASVALAEGLHVKQSEVHGMAQRGGAVLSLLRLSDEPIHSDLIAHGTAHVLLGLEPVESLRYLDLLSPEGTVVTSLDPLRNIQDYPDVAAVRAELARWPRCIFVEAADLARRSGSPLTSNVVMIGAAAHLLPVSVEGLEAHLRERFAPKGDAVVAANLRALQAGSEAVACPAR